ncbi:hypothetical protein LGK95_21665 [Clostridium algoriphilum]|uniref:CBO0543 family protein n=1 Tax=Clostridium algoriphilum TaxID=198347 RepID=UPI001CF42581|nr:CBO0543 family protein [Clostridium algoriphilum]MCB2296061.1 hypothetical protein [Clostridium algoriphilum]
MNTHKIIEEAYKMIVKGNNEIVKVWFTHVVFSWRWWIGITLTILPWFIWIKVRDKKDTVRLLFVGLIVMLITVFMDNIGINYGLWYYEFKILPISNSFFPWNYTLFPISIMLILQNKPQINAYIKAISFSFVCSFIAEPFFEWLNIYHMIKWENWYSFIIYISLYLFFNYVYKSIK